MKFHPSGRYLPFAEREEIALLRAQDKGVRRSPGRSGGSLDDLTGAAAQHRYRSGKLQYRASVAQWKADMAARRPKTAKVVVDPQRHGYVQQRLSGHISRPDGTTIAGP